MQVLREHGTGAIALIEIFWKEKMIMIVPFENPIKKLQLKVIKSTYLSFFF